MRPLLSDVSLSDDTYNISVFGNPMIPVDSLPIRILPLLEEEFPHIHFSVDNPTEYLDGPETEWWMLDTVEGIDGVALFEDVTRFETPSTLTVHEYDLSMDLKLLHKLGKIKKVKIIGISPKLTEEEAFERVASLLRANGF